MQQHNLKKAIYSIVAFFLASPLYLIANDSCLVKSDYEYSVIYDRYIVAKHIKDITFMDLKTKMISPNRPESIKNYSVDSIYCILTSFNNDRIQIYLDEKKIFDEVVKINRINGYSGGFIFKKDANKRQLIKVIVNDGRKMFMEIDPDLNFLEIVYMNDINLIKLIQTNLISIAA